MDEGLEIFVIICAGDIDEACNNITCIYLYINLPIHLVGDLSVQTNKRTDKREERRG